MFQFPDERSRVRHLLDSITTMDAPLLATIAKLGLENKGVIDDFEKASTHLMMHDSLVKRKSVSGTANRDNLSHV